MASARHPQPRGTPRAFLSGFWLWLVVGLAALFLGCVAFSLATRSAMSNLPFLQRSRKGAAGVVDTRSWQTAQALAAVAVTAEEKGAAREAERYADQGVEQAFAAALRQSALKKRTLTGDALALSRKVSQLQEAVAADQARVDALSKSAASSGSSDLDIAKAQLGLDNDELADARQDLARSGGDDQQRIERELASYQAAVRQEESQQDGGGQTAVASARQHGTLASRLSSWLDQRTRAGLLQQAIQEANSDAAALSAEHDKLEAQSGAEPVAGAASTAADTLAYLKDKSVRSQLMATYDARIEADKQLASVYQKWDGQLQLQHAIVLHLLAQSCAMVVFLLIAVILLDRLALRFVERPSLDRRRAHTLRVVFRLGIELTGALLLLLLVFGAPSQTPTILGITTAGLTVVLQDFILAFFGWFVLMGKGGLRVGDRVEIDGVAGEVAEIGLFRTALLETGNWTDRGHPTGRRITFLNSYAIRGHCFNFSTANQWMWDEIQFGVPSQADAFSLMKEVHKAATEGTEKDARLAEEEWKHASGRSGFSHLSAAPAVEMRPDGAGIALVIRYVARASDRLEARNRMYERVIGLMHKPSAA
ncbi:MAG TPA: mechanosensitive ion channel domain-containing protein [Bryobacteraceae bacterium]|nr:mechanosensitive ion channel domain-containing protein [Bryobacteraceae bacterium]